MDILQGKSKDQKVFRLDFSLTPAQKEIESGAKRFSFIRAGRKFGKTRYAEWKALNWLGKPDSVHWHIAPTYAQAKLISWNSFKKVIPGEIISKIDNSDLTITLKNRSQLYLMGSDNDDSLRGPAPTSMTLEEAAYHKGHVWGEILEPNLSVHKGPALFISTPNGYNWFKDLEDSAEGDPLWATFHYSIYDNPHIDRAEIERIKAKCDPRVWSQEYMANYESSVGRVFYEFQDTSRHVYSFPMPVKSDSCFRAIDWGLRDDTATVWGMVRGQKVFIYRENAENGLSPTAQAQIIKNRTPSTETIEGNIIGHDAARQDVSLQGLTVQWHFTNAGIRPLRLSSRNKEASRAHLQTLISEDRLIIHPECRKLRKQLLSYSWKDTAMEKTDDGGDDLVDALHYLVEMLQYRLFLNDRVQKEKSLEEIYKEIREEKKQKSINRYALEADVQSHHYDTSGSPAGYL